ncbi:hypothetical protein FRX31_005046, partial [Thalictrum thalictroides]
DGLASCWHTRKFQAQLTRQTTDLSSVSQDDFRNVLELAPRLLEELMKGVQKIKQRDEHHAEASD